MKKVILKSGISVPAIGQGTWKIGDNPDKREQEIAALAALIKNVPVAVTGTRDYNEAIVTRGGISVREIDPSTMEVRGIAGLYAAGEVLDVDGDCGGFNLQWAWSSALLAAAGMDAELRDGAAPLT